MCPADRQPKGPHVTVTGSAGAARGLHDRAQHFGHKGYEFVQGLEPGDFPGHHMLHAPGQAPGVHGCLSPKLDYKGLCGGIRWTLLKISLHRGASSVLECVWTGSVAPSVPAVVCGGPAPPWCCEGI